ncbi:MAG: hypothetical protein JO006_00870 [Paucibacter sp.]|nr:hypothetical protein [Roseateles sp.]
MCPRCKSDSVARRNLGRKTIGAIGAAIGLFAGWAGTAGGAEAGMAIGAAGGPAGMAAGSILGALIGALAAGASACVAGSILGQRMDDNVLDTYRCLDCDFTFSDAAAPQSEMRMSSPTPSGAWGTDFDD